MTRPVEFTEYNGWKNYATWAAFTYITGSDRLRPLYSELARKDKVREHLTLKMEGFFSIVYRDRSREILMQDWITCATQWIDWPGVLHMLRGRHAALVLEQEPTNLDMVAVAYFETIPGIWQTIVSGAKGGEDQALKDWVTDGIITWIESPDARAHASSPVSLFIKSCFDIVIGSIDWDRLTEALKEQ